MIDGHIHLEYGDYTLEYIQKFVDKAVEMKLDEIWLLEHNYMFPEFAPMYDSVCAHSSFVNDWFQNETWFTFRLRNSGSRYPEYRIEIEKTGFGIRRNNDKTEEDLGCPVILKEVSKEEDLWTSPYKINETLQKEYAF